MVEINGEINENEERKLTESKKTVVRVGPERYGLAVRREEGRCGSGGALVLGPVLGWGSLCSG